MKVIMLNGSRRSNGCTYTALSIVAEELAAAGIENEIISVGSVPAGSEMKDLVKTVGEKLRGADGLVIGTPVYYASPSGEIVSFLDRLFWEYGRELRLKPGAVLASARRAGTTASLDVLMKYLTIAEMPVVSSRYWNMVHGNTPAEVLQDREGVLIMQTLGRNMAWLLKCIDAGRTSGIALPEQLKREHTNFIR